MDAAASASKAQPGANAAQEAPAKADTESTQSLLKPEILLADDEPTLPAIAETPLPEAAQVLEVDPDAPLTLDSALAVDKMLSAPPPSPASPPAQSPSLRIGSDPQELTLLPDTEAPAKPAAETAPAPKPASASTAPAARATAAAEPPAAPALVPLARRASLTAAAQKLAASAAAAPPSAEMPPKPAAPSAPVAPAKPRIAPTGAAASVTPIARKPASAPTASPATPEAPPAPAAPPPPEAPSLASWANARAAAAASTKAGARPGSPPAKPAQPAQPAQIEKPRTASARPTPPTAPPPAAAAASPAAAATSGGLPARGMDRDFIARNQVVERYLSGKLPIKAATDFERYCKEHPELLDELGLPERVNAGVRLLEASGKPEPWQEAAKPIWQRPATILGTASLAALLALVLAIVAVGSAGKTRKLLELQRQVTDRTLDAATGTRIIRVLPNRTGASNTPAIWIGGGAAQLVDLRIDESRSPYKDFRITIDRLDQGRVMVIDNLTKDSNGHLRVQVNSSAFGPGNYLLTIEGLTLRLEPQPDSWVTIGIAQR